MAFHFWTFSFDSDSNEIYIISMHNTGLLRLQTIILPYEDSFRPVRIFYFMQSRFVQPNMRSDPWKCEIIFANGERIRCIELPISVLYEFYTEFLHNRWNFPEQSHLFVFNLEISEIEVIVLGFYSENEILLYRKAQIDKITVWFDVWRVLC